MPRHTLPYDPDQPDFIDRIEQAGDVRILRLRGRIDQTTVEGGYRYIVNLHEEGEEIQANLLIDCKNVDRVDLSAVALLVVRMQDYLAAGRAIALLNCDRRIRTYIELAELQPRVRIYDSEQGAIAALSDSGATARD